jgi:DNA-binding transcriptional LysR family regulator
MASLTIAFVPGVSPAKWARIWRERFASIELVLQPIGPDDVDAALAADVDMAFARLPVSDSLQAIPLWHETPVAAVPKDSEFAAVDELSPADVTSTPIIIDHLGNSGPLASTVPADVDGVLDLVEAGTGIAVLPQSLFRAASRKALVARPVLDIPPTRVALVWRAADASDLTEEFVGVVRGRTTNSSRGSKQPEPTVTPRREQRRARPATGRSGGSSRTGQGRRRSR